MSKDSIIKKASVSKLYARLNQPFKISLGSHEAVENILLTIELENGIKGYGEAAIATHITGENYENTFKNLKDISEEIEGLSIFDYLKLSNKFQEMYPNNKAAVTAFDMAIIDALTRYFKIPLWRFFGNTPSYICSDMTVVIGTPDEAEDSAKAIYSQGIRSFKVKVGIDDDEDYERLIRIKKVIGDCPLYLDANQGYTPLQTVKFLKRLKLGGIIPVLIEQPVHKDDFMGLKYVSENIDIPVCADESVFTVSDVLKIIDMNACSAVNIKLMKTGIFMAREIANLCKIKGIKLMIGGMVETLLAMTCSAHFACGLQGFDYIDLDTPFFIKDTIMKGDVINLNGEYILDKIESGIGIEPCKI